MILDIKADVVCIAVQFLKYVTRFSCDTFGFYVAAVYVQYGIQVVTRQFGQSSVTAAFLGILYVHERLPRRGDDTDFFRVVWR